MLILAPFGWIYGGVMQLRNALYDRGVFGTHDLGARTISVGNITTGGTGKTPLVALIAEMLAEDGEKVCILTRGYGRKNEITQVLVSDWDSILVDAETGGDEPVVLANKLLRKAVVMADADRIAAAHWAKDKFGITAFVLDDGFQHRRAKRDLDIVCIDATDPFANRRTLPAGNLREPLQGLSRADAFVITRANQSKDISEIENQLKRKNNSARIFGSNSSITGFVRLEQFHAKSQRTQSSTPSSSYAFCGIGNPDSFLRSLSDAGVERVGHRAFRDHVRYDQGIIENIENDAKTKNASSLVTTAKDAVKLAGLNFTLPCYVATLDIQIDDLAAFREMIISS